MHDAAMHPAPTTPFARCLGAFGNQGVAFARQFFRCLFDDPFFAHMRVYEFIELIENIERDRTSRTLCSLCSLYS